MHGMIHHLVEMKNLPLETLPRWGIQFALPDVEGRRQGEKIIEMRLQKLQILGNTFRGVNIRNPNWKQTRKKTQQIHEVQRDKQKMF